MKKRFPAIVLLLMFLLTACGAPAPAPGTPLQLQIRFGAAQELCPEIVSRGEDGYSVLGLEWGLSQDEVLSRTGIPASAAADVSEEQFSVFCYLEKLRADGKLTFFFSEDGFCMAALSVTADIAEQEELKQWAEVCREPLQLSGSDDWENGGMLRGGFEKGDQFRAQFVMSSGDPEKECRLLIQVGQYGKDIFHAG
ncbi:MAG: hypothetical protein PUC59_00465 [Firmicutes bacterium]|nr:hypothetical protein [Bacillota bacterium]